MLPPSFIRRILCMIYDGLLLAAMLFIAGFAFIYLTDYPNHPGLRPLLQIFWFCRINSKSQRLTTISCTKKRQMPYL